MTSKVVELFGRATFKKSSSWAEVVAQQQCPFLHRNCYKVRKSDPQTSIGTCTVAYGPDDAPVIICPTRLTDSGQIFSDCLHLLTSHEPGNELHVVPEVSIPGGSVDFFLVSVRAHKVRDFVGIELQTLDTTGTVWPERQRLLRYLGVQRRDQAEDSASGFGMNWKMTAKTILVQMHHKAQTFEHVNKKLVLVVQDRLLSYMRREFKFDHLQSPASLGDTVQFHPYALCRRHPSSFGLELQSRLSTDAAGIAECLGLQAEARVELDQIVRALESKISKATRFRPI